MPATYERDADGNVLNPPINRALEDALNDAHNRADQADINALTDEYHSWRDEKIQRDEEAANDERQPAQNLNAGRGDSATTPAQDASPAAVDTDGDNDAVPTTDVPTHDAAAPASGQDATAAQVSDSTGQGA